MALSDTKIRAAKPKEKDYKLADEKGLYLLVKPAGGKYWRFKYRFDGKERKLSIGVYPDVSLAHARQARDSARTLLAQSIDPGLHKKAAKMARIEAAGNSFEIVAREWFDKRGPKSESADKRLVRMLEKDLFPLLGMRPVGEITPPELLHVLRRIEGRGAIETAHRAKQLAGMVFRYAVATGRAERDPSADLRGALKSPTSTHFAAITDSKGTAELLRAIFAYNATPVVMSALRLAPYLFCRPGELRSLEWSEINIEEARIELPAAKMKMKDPHIIPLSRQVTQLLEKLRPLTGRGEYVFPSARGGGRPMSENALRVALRTIGYSNEQMTPHGFRAMARTLLDEVLGFPVDWIEHQLAHAVKDANGRAYNRTKYLEQRRKMMQCWADYLDGLREDKFDAGIPSSLVFRAY